MASEAATIYKRQSGNGRKRLVVRKRQRGNRQLFGNRVVAAAPFAAAPALVPAPVPALRFAPQPLVQPIARPVAQPIRVVEVNPNFFNAAPAAAPAPIATPAPIAAPAPIQAAAAPVIQVRQEPVFTAPVTVAAATRQTPTEKPIAITRSVYNAPGTIVDR